MSAVLPTGDQELMLTKPLAWRPGAGVSQTTEWRSGSRMMAATHDAGANMILAWDQGCI